MTPTHEAADLLVPRLMLVGTILAAAVAARVALALAA